MTMPARSRVANPEDFGRAFERICNLVSIAESQKPLKTLRHLVEQCFVVLPDEPYRTPEDIKNALDVLFGIDAPLENVRECITQLQRDGSIRQVAGLLILEGETRSRLTQRVIAAQGLETNVRRTWELELGPIPRDCDASTLWIVLRDFLAMAFRRHGLQATRMLDPTLAAGPNGELPLSDLLHDAVAAHVAASRRQFAAGAIASFFATIGSHPERASYISQLADGAFVYFSVAIDPQAAEEFVARLDSLNIFLDTNILFGVLGLNSGPAVGVAAELVQTVAASKLPFHIYYHPRTSRELRSTITYYGGELQGRVWPAELSRSIVATRSASGMVARYHELNAQQAVRPEDFVRPLSQVDAILKSTGVALFPINQGATEVSPLIAQYREYLTTRNRPKRDSVIEHDMTVLQAVRDMHDRRPANHLGQRAILLTFDYNLYRFDQDTSIEMGRDPVVALPNVFMQVIRPLVSNRPGFDRAFAETFALPEFRTVGSGSSDAMLRLISVMASFRNISEDLAAKILTNATLRDRLRDTPTDAELAAGIELAIAEQNRALVDHAADLERDAYDARSEKAQLQRALDQLRNSKDVALDQRAQRIKNLEDQIEQLAETIRAKDLEVGDLRQLAMPILDPQVSPAAASIESPERRSNPKASYSSDMIAVAMGGMMAAIWLLAVHAFSIDLILARDRTIGIQGSIALLLFAGIAFPFAPRLRAGIGIVGIIGVLAAAAVGVLTMVDNTPSP